MYLNNKLIKNIAILLVLGIAIGSCQKLTHPPLGDYPKDSNVPGGPLKFYAAMDGSSVDSIRANFGIDNSVTYVAGVSGKAAQFDGTKNGYISWPSANDFGASTDFSISLWMNVTLAQKDHVNADGVLAFANSKNFWGNFTIFADHESSTSDSMPLKIVFNTGGGNTTFQLGGYRWPHMYDGNWHHVAFTYASASATVTAYLDGAQFFQEVLTNPAVFDNTSQLVAAGFQEAVGIVSTYKDNTWMSGFPGMIDNIRLYGETLGASDITALYTNKQ